MRATAETVDFMVMSTSTIWCRNSWTTECPLPYLLGFLSPYSKTLLYDTLLLGYIELIWIKTNEFQVITTQNENRSNDNDNSTLLHLTFLVLLFILSTVLLQNYYIFSLCYLSYHTFLLSFSFPFLSFQVTQWN